MDEQYPMKIIAHIHTDFSDKFGIPRQSGLVSELQGIIQFAPEYRNVDAVRGLEGFSHIWIVWQFSASLREAWSPTVRPPRLGGNTRLGVFATRSPFRPNAIGLSCVKLVRVDAAAKNGPLLYVSGADLLDGTPIFDIKPYLPYADSIPDATGGFTDRSSDFLLQVECSDEQIRIVPEDKRKALLGVLSHDPRPSYQDDPERIYGLSFAGMNIRFKVAGSVLTVLEIK